METPPIDFNSLILILEGIWDAGDSMILAANIVGIVREQLGVIDDASTNDSRSDSAESDEGKQRRSTSTIDSDTDDNEEDDEWLETYPNEDGFLINDEGRIHIHGPFVHVGAVGFAPSLMFVPLYLECDCAHHALPECCLDSEPPFNFFINHYDESLRVDFDGEFDLARTAFTENNPLRQPNNRQRHRLYTSIFLALDFGELLPGERRKLPNCVCAKVRQLYPDGSGCYMEFKEGRKPRVAADHAGRAEHSSR